MNLNGETNYKPTKVWPRAMNAFLGSFLLSYNIGVFTSCQPSVSSALNWGEDSDTYIAVMSSLVPLGAMFGALSSGILSKSSGRRRSLLISDLITILASIITVIPNTYSFGIGRFLSGIAIGQYSVICPLYVNEISPQQITGRLSSLIQPFCCTGLICAFGFALLLPTNNYSEDPRNNLWIFMFAFQGVIASLQIIIFLVFFQKETAPWLISKNRIDEALESLKEIYLEEKAEEMLESLQRKTSLMLNKNDSITTLEFTYCEYLKCARGTSKAMRIGLMLSIVQQFSGINAILSYATTLFGEFGSGVFISRVLTLANGFVNFSSTFCLMPVIDRYGRKWTLILGTFTMGLCLALMGIFYQLQVFYVFPFLIVQLYVSCFGLSIGPICWIYSGEILSSKGMSICAAVNWFSAFVVILIFPFMAVAVGLSFTFWIFAGVNTLGCVYFGFDMIETKGMMKHEIQTLFISMK